MKETVFIKKYQDKWKELEVYLQKGGKSDPDYLSGLYVQLTDDLSYAKTHYPKSKITQYLNQLSSKLHTEIYRNKKERSNRFVEFWQYELPITMYKYRKAVLISFLGLIISICIGWISGANDEGFVRLVLGDAYVDKTEQLIEKGDPLGIYGQDNEVDMFLYITRNNIQVCILFFVVGALAGVGSLYVIVKNGIMLGAFLYMFYSKGFSVESLMALWMHGVVEISVMVFSGAAGMTLASSFLFPGTYTLGESIKRGAKDGLKILFGVVPLLVVAGFIESFMTRHHNVVLLSLGTILLSLGFIISYFVIYPFMLGTREKRNSIQSNPFGYQYPAYKIKIMFGALITVCAAFATYFTYASGAGAIVIFSGALTYGIVKIIQGLVEWQKFRNKKVKA